MRHTRAYFSKRMGKRGRNEQRGVALLTALLLLMLMTGLSVAMVISVRSDLLINGYYRDFRGSFYAADSGLNIARQAIVNQINTDLNTLGSSYNPATTAPLSTSEDSTINSLLTGTYGSGYTSLNQGNAAGSWPEKFQITNENFQFVQCTPIGTTGTCAAPTGIPCGYNYIYSYSLTGVGQSQGNESTTLADAGNVFVKTSVPAGSPNCPTSFAAFGMFIDQWNICSGSTLVPGMITGPVFTNGSWTFGTTGNYIFTDPVGSAGADAGYQFSSSCDQVAGPSDKKGGVTIAPTFQNGFNLGQPQISLPQNSFNQEQAVLDSIGNANGASVNNNALSKGLLDVNGNPYPSKGASSGVFLPYQINKSGQATLAPGTGGGIYVEGDASVVLSTSGASAEVYTITQGGTVTTVTIDPVANTTVFSQGTATVQIAGVPTLLNQASGTTSPSTMLYVDGNITSLSGPAEGVAGIQDGTALTITAAGNVTVTGDILYKTEPVTTTQNQIPNTPADTLIPGNNNGQTLGIFTSTGNIYLNDKQSDGNLEIDGSLATISKNGSGALINDGNAINTLTIIGGRIQNTIQNINTTTRNVFFDRRYAQGLTPPWFPSYVTNASGPVTFQTSIARTTWANTHTGDPNW